MKTKMTQAISAALLLSLLTACGGAGASEAQTTSADVPETTAPVTEAGPVFPDVSYGGEEIHF